MCSFSHSSLLHPSFLLFLPTGIMDAAQRRMASLAAHVSAPQVRVSSERAKRREKLNGEEKRRRHRRRRRLASEVLMQSALIRLWFQHTIPAFSCPIHRPRHQKYMHSSRPRKRERETKASPLFLELIDNNQTKKKRKNRPPPPSLPPLRPLLLRPPVAASRSRSWAPEEVSASPSACC